MERENDKPWARQPIDPRVLVKALELYNYNVSPVEAIHTFLPTAAHPDYIAEKVEAYARYGLLGFFGLLDGRATNRMIEQVLARYGDEAEIGVGIVGDL